MSTLAQTPTGDLELDFGLRLQVIDDTAQQTAIKLRNRLLFLSGEWFLDTRLGMPYRTYMYVKSPQLPLIRQMFLRAITGTPGVREVLTLSLLVTPERELRVASRVLLTSGVVVASDGVGAPFVIEIN